MFVSARLVRSLLVALLLTGIGQTPALAANTAPLLRTPDIHGDTVVFVHGADIWTAPAAGGQATRLTIDPGDETNPRFSPNGSYIAFDAHVDGNADVYVMGRDGSGITRVTFHPGQDNIVGWHPTNGKILFRSSRNQLSRASRLYLINPDGTGLEVLPMAEAGTGSFSPDAESIVYTRVFRETRTWKRYQGGMAQDVWRYDFATGTETRLTDFIGTDRRPMWIGDAVYFVSDREKTLNVFAMAPAGGAARKVTDHDVYDARFAEDGTGQIVYEHGGDVVVLDPATGATRKVDVTIGPDVPDTRPVVISAADRLTGAQIDRRGEQVVAVARGEVFVVPVEGGRTVNLSRHAGARDHAAVFSPDGQQVAYLSDRDGEYGIWLQPADGSEPPRQLTEHKSGYRHALRWSPNGKKIAFTDETLRLFHADAESGKVTRVAKASFENVDVSLHNKPISDYCWSPDSRWIAYSHLDADLLYRVYVHNVKSGENHEISRGLYNDFSPAFSADGRHLFFASNRTFNPTYGDFEWEMVYKDATGLFAVALTADAGPVVPLPGADGDLEKSDFKEVSVKIDFAGLADRIERLPVPPANYRDLQAGPGALFYLNGADGDYNRFEFRGLPARDLGAFDLDSAETRTVITGVQDYALAAGGEHLVYRRGRDLGVVKASASDAKHEALDLGGLRFTLDPREEWRQVFRDAWRFERDYYYDPNMHGLDWAAMHDKYLPLVERAVCRQDIRYIVGELIGELNASHTYSYGGDNRRTGRQVSVGMLGADWAVDGDHWRIARILRAGDWTRDVMPPLVRPGLDVRDGDYLLAVDGTPVDASRNIYSYFVDLAGRQVALTVNDKPEWDDAREVIVVPLRSENVLRYHDWVEGNRQKVAELSGGRIGYMHFPDTFNGTAREFGRQFYGQTRKEGLIIDGRHNNGGLDPDIFLQRLDKDLHTYWTRRHSHHQTTPFVVTRAHMALLTNRQAGSGGDMLPMEFQMRGMGPVIGTRTWGGLVGVSQFIGLMDGGGLTAPDYRIYDQDGTWIVEGEGVTPDMIVEQDSADLLAGRDTQLRAAIDHLLARIAAEPRPWPQHEPAPVYE